MTRNALSIGALLLLVSALPAAPQSKAAPQSASKPTNEEQNIDAYVGLLRQDVRKQKVAIISQMMNFSAEDAEKFWPVYDAYSKELQQIGDEKYAGIKEFSAAWPNLSDAKIDELAKKALDLEDRTTALKKKYYERVKEAVSVKAAGKFLQVENQLLMLVNLQLAASLPIVE